VKSSANLQDLQVIPGNGFLLPPGGEPPSASPPFFQEGDFKNKVALLTFLNILT